MSYNRTLVVGASIAIGLAGDAAPKVFSHLSPACQQTLGIAASNALITQACGPNFSDVSLLWVILLGIGAFLVINFWKDILQFLGERENSKSTY
jgi:hypothetical protein